MPLVSVSARNRRWRHGTGLRVIRKLPDGPRARPLVGSGNGWPPIAAVPAGYPNQIAPSSGLMADSASMARIV